MSEMETWTCVRVRPAQEARVLAAMAACGVAAYAPMETCWRPRAKYKTTFQRPLIRGYVFARLDSVDRFRPHGAMGLLVSGSEPAQIPADFVEGLREAESAGAYDHTAGRGRRLAVGAKVRVRQGPFTGFVGTLAKLPGPKRAQVLLEMFGRATAHTVAVEQLEAA